MSPEETQPRSKHPPKPQEEIGATSGQRHDELLERTLGRERAHHLDGPSKPGRVIRDEED